MIIKNNPKNRRGLLDYQRRQLELSNITEMDARKRRIVSNVEKWTNNLPEHLKNATHKNLPASVIEKIKNTNTKPPYNKYTIISAQDLDNARFTSYAIIDALLRKGIATPSQVKITDIMDGYNNINGMFSARRWKDYFFEHDSKVLLIEGSSKALALLGSKGEVQFWREIIELSKNRDKLVIITYRTDDEEEEKKVFIPFLTSDRNLNSRIVRNSLFVRMSENEEQEMSHE